MYCTYRTCLCVPTSENKVNKFQVGHCEYHKNNHRYNGNNLYIHTHCYVPIQKSLKENKWESGWQHGRRHNNNKRYLFFNCLQLTNFKMDKNLKHRTCMIFQLKIKKNVCCTEEKRKHSLKKIYFFLSNDTFMHLESTLYIECAFYYLF